MTDDTSTGFETVAGPAPVELPVELTPSVIEAQVMFTENPGLAAVHTTEGILHRDGVLQRMAIGE